ncbi:MAG: NTP transferase domain-containing protein [Opitutaceae bacterium]
MRVIILAAGQGFMLDGMVKCLVRAPHDGRALLEKAIEAFAGHRITVVVGFRAVAVMEAFPELDYVYNPDWATTNNAHSLGLALTDEPSYVLSSDLVFEPELVRELDEAAPDLVLTERRENRILTSVNCALEQERVREFYVGPLRTPLDPEAVGLFKVSHPSILRGWRRNCLRHGNLFVGQNLPVTEPGADIRSHDLGDHLFYEINHPADYLRALRAHRAAAPLA